MAFESVDVLPVSKCRVILSVFDTSEEAAIKRLHADDPIWALGARRAPEFDGVNDCDTPRGFAFVKHTARP
jgi:hypothetical protein